MNIDISESRKRISNHEHNWSRSEKTAEDMHRDRSLERSCRISWNIFVDLKKNDPGCKAYKNDQYSGIVCSYRLNDLIWRMLRGTVHDHDDFLA